MRKTLARKFFADLINKTKQGELIWNNLRSLYISEGNLAPEMQRQIDLLYYGPYAVESLGSFYCDYEGGRILILTQIIVNHPEATEPNNVLNFFVQPKTGEEFIRFPMDKQLEDDLDLLFEAVCPVGVVKDIDHEQSTRLEKFMSDVLKESNQD